MKFLKLLEYGFRHGLVYPLLRLVINNHRFEGTIDITRIKKLLILRHDAIGDMIVTTPIFRNLKKLNPNLYIAVFARPANAEIIRFNPYVDRIHILPSNWFRMAAEIIVARKEDYDVVLQFVFNKTTSGALMANLIAPRGIKVAQGAEKYGFYFNRFLKLSRYSTHMAEVLAAYVEEVFGIRFMDKDFSLEIDVDAKSEANVNNFLRENRLRRKTSNFTDARSYVVFNLSAKDQARKLSLSQGIVLAKHLAGEKNMAVILVSAPDDIEMRKKVANGVSSGFCRSFVPRGEMVLLEIASLIEGALCVFTPDTSIIHFASAKGTPVMGLFRHQKMTTEWLPYKVNHVALLAPESLTVSEIPVETILQKADEFLDSLNVVAG